MRESNTNTPENSLLQRGRGQQFIIRLESATLRIRDSFLLSDTSWQIGKGQHWAILGPNGAGKTTLLKALTGEVPVVRGTITYLSVWQASRNRGKYLGH
jgi:ABC-type molybdenum transport system ATPase subunit/photorepair protein PhrA